MRKYLFCLAVALVVPVSQADASRVGVSLGINIGVPAVVAPVYAPQPVVIEEPPQFFAPPGLGFYIATGVPYDLFFASNRYYLHRANAWYSSSYYNGPWVTVGYNTIPHGIRSLPFERVHYYRDNYYRHYSNDRYGRDYRHFRPADHRWDRNGHVSRSEVNHAGWRRAAVPAWNKPAAGGGKRSGHGIENRHGSGHGRDHDSGGRGR
jgi:hypothetical protein